LVGAFWLYKRSAPKDIEVPDLIGKTRSAAEADLQRVGMRLRVAREEYSAEVPKGQVTHTEPAAGMRVKEGRIVSAVLSRGAELILVPDVRQASLQRAKDLLTQVELVPGEVRQDYDEVIPAGYISRQSPPARSRVPKGSQVALQVSKGRAAGMRDHEGDQPEAQPAGPKKQARIRMRVPAGTDRQEVRFVVSDDRGDHVAYERLHAPGDEIVKTVEGQGERVRLRVYLDGKLVRDKPLE
jgi:serine/threonine-protein kinase